MGLKATRERVSSIDVSVFEVKIKLGNVIACAPMSFVL